MKKLILLFALPSLFLTACQEQNSEQTETALMKVNVVQVQPATLTQTLSLSGSIMAKEDVAVGTALLGNQQIECRPISLGEVNQNTAEILSDLEVGEQVVQKAGALINEGDWVETIVR